jgi:hypothetical protein
LTFLSWLPRRLNLKLKFFDFIAVFVNELKKMLLSLIYTLAYLLKLVLMSLLKLRDLLFILIIQMLKFLLKDDNFTS